jgi:hypothetical protein
LTPRFGPVGRLEQPPPALVEVGAVQPVGCDPGEGGEVAEQVPLPGDRGVAEPERRLGGEDTGVQLRPVMPQRHPRPGAPADEVVRGGPKPAGRDQPGQEPVGDMAEGQLFLEEERVERFLRADLRQVDPGAPAHLVVRAQSGDDQVGQEQLDELVLALRQPERRPAVTQRRRGHARSSPSRAASTAAYSAASQEFYRCR